MKTESVKYSVGSLACRGELVYDETVKAQRPLLLVAPNWLGVTADVIERESVAFIRRVTGWIATNAAGASWLGWIR